MGTVISFPIRAELQAAFIHLCDDGRHFLYTEHLIDRRNEIVFQTPDDITSYGCTSAKLASIVQSDSDVINLTTGQPLFKYKVEIPSTIIVDRPFIGIAAIGQDVSVTSASTRRIEVHDRMNFMLLFMGLSEAGLHIRSRDHKTHFLFRLKSVDSFAK